MERHKWRWRSMVEKDAEGFSKIPLAGICILAEADTVDGLVAALARPRRLGPSCYIRNTYTTCTTYTATTAVERRSIWSKIPNTPP